MKLTDPPPKDLNADIRRVLNHLHGGKDNFEDDREVSNMMVTALPTLPRSVRATRGFLRRAIKMLVAEYGVNQFIEIGTGFPILADNLFEFLSELVFDPRVVYVEGDATAAAYVRALLLTDDGSTALVKADAAVEPETILSAPPVTTTLDMSKPIAVLLVAPLMLMNDDAAHRAARALIDAAPAGSWLVVCHLTADWQSDEVQEIVDAATVARLGWRARSEAEVAKFLTGLDLAEPGQVPLYSWRPEASVFGPADPLSAPFWVAVGRKP